jgi:hypothetical protein
MYILRIEHHMEQWDRPFGYRGMPIDEAIKEAESILRQSRIARNASGARLFMAIGEQVACWDLGLSTTCA